MKKIIVIIFSFLFVSAKSFACEICGCGTGSYYIGLLPQFHHHFFGMRYQFSSFKTVMKDDASQYSNDLFQTAELWGGWNIGKRWQLIAMLPYNIIQQSSDDGKVSRSGIGDALLMGNYKLLDISSATASKKLVQQQLWIGAGIKLASGKFIFDPTDEALAAVANTQAGTASTDFLLNAMHNIAIGSFGINTSARYKINTTNSDRYAFGNRFAAGSLAYYSFAKSKTVITPNAGLLYEHSAANKLQNEKVEFTGGYLLGAAAGLEINIKSVTIGGNVQIPLVQDFADGQTKTKLKGMLHVAVSF
jgi:hypothetical protein